MASPLTDLPGDPRCPHDWHKFESVPTGEWWACLRCDARAVTYDPTSRPENERG